MPKTIMPGKGSNSLLPGPAPRVATVTDLQDATYFKPIATYRPVVGAAALDIPLPSGFQHFHLKVRNLNSSSSGTFLLYLLDALGLRTETNYAYRYGSYSTGASWSSGNNQIDSYTALNPGAGTSGPFSGHIEFWDLLNPNADRVTWQSRFASQGGYTSFVDGWKPQTTRPFTGIRIGPPGPFAASGAITLYGIKEP